LRFEIRDFFIRRLEDGGDGLAVSRCFQGLKLFPEETTGG
jgi:hypothetical protein